MDRRAEPRRDDDVVRLNVLLEGVDDLQRRRRPLGIAYAIIKRFGESGAGFLAATVAYYGFFSLFPLLMVLVSVAGFVLHDPRRCSTD